MKEKKNLTALFQQMQTIVDSKMESYKTDLRHDMERLKVMDEKKESISLVWIIRPDGTSLIDLNDKFAKEKLDGTRSCWANKTEYLIEYEQRKGWSMKELLQKGVA